MKPRLSRSLRRLLAGMIICGQTAFAASLDWNGTTDNHVWNTVPGNEIWQSGVSPAAFSAGDNVNFGNSSASSTVDVGSDIVAGTVEVEGDYTLNTTSASQISGVFSGTGQLTKSGPAALRMESTGASSGLSLSVESGELVLGGNAAFNNVQIAPSANLTVAENADIRIEGTNLNALAEQSSVTVKGMMSSQAASSVNLLNNTGVSTFNAPLVAKTVNNTGSLVVAADSTVSSLQGNGSLNVAEGVTLQLQNDSGVGKLSNSGTISSTNGLTLNETTSNGGTIIADSLSLVGQDVFRAVTTRSINFRGPITSMRTGTLSGIDNAMNVNLERVVRGSGVYTLATATDLGDTTYTLTKETIERELYWGYDATLQTVDNKLVMVLDSADANYVGRHASSGNAQSGAKLLDATFAQIDPQTATNRPSHSDLAAVLDAVDEYIVRGNGKEVSQLSTAFAGAGVTAIGAAWRGQMERQLRAIRNRTTSLQGGMPCEEITDAKGERCSTPPYTVWANAEIDYHHLNDSGDTPGYKLNSLGGTVGFAAQTNEEMTLGAAFTGMSGRLSAKSYGSDASGDLDAYYASVFARRENGCVTHTLVGTVGFADAMLKRRVYYPGGGYTAKGDTDGIGYGLMYEVGRTYRVNREYMTNAWWQPVFNVSYIHSSIDGYSETGSDAALRVGKQKSNNVIFGLGARLQSEVAHEWLNRSALWEMRVLAKATTGARREKASVSIPGVDSSATVRGAEAGAFGVELGIGMTMPLGPDCGAVFMDCTAEFAKNYNSVNGVLGYRIDF